MRVNAVLVLLIPTALLGGCRNEDRHEFTLTPEGYLVEWDGYQGPARMTVEEIYVNFDESLIRACGHLYRYGIQPEETQALARRCKFTMIDSTFFNVQGRGAYGSNMNGYIKVAMHRDLSGPPGTPFPAEALPWTCRIGHITGNSYWGVWNPTDTFPALGHELGHERFGPDFEHSYFPPVVNP